MYTRLLVLDAGFVSIEAASADEALGILHERDDVRIVFTDVEIPGSTLNGFDLVEVVRKKWPWIELIVASGHVEIKPERLPERVQFFRKPYGENEIIMALKAMAAASEGAL